MKLGLPPLPISKHTMIINLQIMIFPLIFSLFLVPFTTSLSFNFTTFDTNDKNITFESSAYAASGIIQLTKNQRDESTLASIGRATYHAPMRLYDNKTRNLTDFETHFSFIIDSLGSTGYGDGLAFFLAPQGSRIPNNVTKGGSLALTSDDQFLNTTANQFVAVEFDIYSNRWDPNGTHVGIDIDSMMSVNNVTWLSSIPNGEKNDVWVNYNSSSKNLTVVFTGFRNSTTVLQSVSYVVDLRLYLPEWVTFGFSAATGNASALHSLYSWSFSSSLEIDENVTVPASPTSYNNTEPSDGNSKRKKGNGSGLAIGLGVGGFVFVGVLGLVLFGFWNKRKRRENGEDDFVFDETMDDEFERGTGPKKFSYKELARATNNFAEGDKLGEGGFGGVYRGFSKDLNSYVAVKKISRGSKQGIKEYASEVRIISRLRHKNLVQLNGWCHEKRELLLVYEFMPNGSLDSHLFKSKSLLTWEIRYKIALGLASALLYLHEEWEQCIVHRDIKSSNVMLDSNFNAKLGDFGLARFVDHGYEAATTVMAGTMGYMAPECVTTGKASKESDVYSFGIVALEIACGRRPVQPKAKENEIMMAEWVWELYGIGTILEAADPRLSEDFDEQQMERLMIVGLWCAHPDSNSRPSIRQAIHVLNFEALLPTLPSTMPVLTYFAPPSTFSLSSGTTTTLSESEQTQSSGFSNNTNSSQFTASSSSSSSTALLNAR